MRRTFRYEAIIRRSNLSATDRGWIGACARWPESVWTADGLTDEAADHAEQIADRILGYGRKGRRVSGLRRSRPSREMLVSDAHLFVRPMIDYEEESMGGPGRLR